MRRALAVLALLLCLALPAAAQGPAARVESRWLLMGGGLGGAAAGVSNILVTH